jgi:hypothetical protein
LLSAAHQRRYPHDENISVNRFLRLISSEPCLAPITVVFVPSQTLSGTFSCLLPAALRSVKIHFISVISGEFLLCPTGSFLLNPVLPTTVFFGRLADVFQQVLLSFAPAALNQ